MLALVFNSYFLCNVQEGQIIWLQQVRIRGVKQWRLCSVPVIPNNAIHSGAKQQLSSNNGNESSRMTQRRMLPHEMGKKILLQEITTKEEYGQAIAPYNSSSEQDVTTMNKRLMPPFLFINNTQGTMQWVRGVCMLKVASQLQYYLCFCTSSTLFEALCPFDLNPYPRVGTMLVSHRPPNPSPLSLPPDLGTR